MKVLFLIRSLERGGAERQLSLLARALHRSGHDVSVAVFYADGPLRAEIEEAGVPVYDLGKSGRWDVPAFLWRLYRLVRRVKPDVLHGYMPVSNILAALIGRLTPGLKVVFGVRASGLDAKRYDRLTRLSTRVEAVLSGGADLTICNSNAGRDDAIARGFSAEKCVVIPNGIDSTVFYPDRTLGVPLRAAWGVAEPEHLVGVVGRIDPMKGHEVFIRAAELAVRDDPSLRFVCIGNGPAADVVRLQELAQSLGVPMIWEPARDDMNAVYNALDLLVSPSLFGEGFSNVLCEAMACGLPCVASRVGDADEIVGDCGVVVEPGDVAGLARGVNRAAQLPKRAVGEAAYSVTALVARTWGALEKVTEGAH